MSATSSPKKARYLELAQYFSHQIKDGHLRPGQRLPSFAQMREQFGVTPATVERLYAVLEREQLIERRNRSGVYVAAAKSTAKRLGTIGFLAQGFSQANLHPYNFRLLSGVLRVAEQAGMQILILDRTSLAAARDKIDGLLIYEVNVASGRADSQLERDRFGLPCVAMLAQPTHTSSVVVNEVLGCRLATDHLLSRGHRRIACLMGSDSLEHRDLLGAQRLRGYREALEAAGLSFDECLVRPLRYRSPGGYAQQGFHEMKEWLEHGWTALGCSAILAQNDETASGIIHALQLRGLRVPEDISVVGYDGVLPANPFGSSLTTIEVPLDQVSAEATRLLLRQIEGDRREEHIVISPRLRVGETT